MIPNPNQSNKGWTFVEMLIAISMAAIFLGAGTLVMHSISSNSKRLTTLATVRIGAAENTNYYGDTGQDRNVYTCPNYGKLAFAQDLREKFLNDVEQCNAIYCLPRTGLNTTRSAAIPFPTGANENSAVHPTLDTPEGFRAHLISSVAGAAPTFTAPIRNIPPATALNISVFMMAPGSNINTMRVHAVYDIDYKQTNIPQGLYASVKRFSADTLTDYYDVFYPGAVTNQNRPSPGFVAFESRNRLARVEGAAIDRFKVAPNSPFYLLWLPDPAINPLDPVPVLPADPATSARAAYGHMATKSSFLVAFPAFPSF